MTYEFLIDAYDPSDPNLWSMMEWDKLPDLTEADLYPDEFVSEPEVSE
jgi:hypothetical protein